LNIENKFKKNQIYFDPNDKRMNTLAEVSSSDDEMEDSEKVYQLSRSNGSFDISNIRCLIYGGISSRFWLFRKYMNNTNPRVFRL